MLIYLFQIKRINTFNKSVIINYNTIYIYLKNYVFWPD